MNETRAASYSRQLFKEVRIWTEGTPAAPVERKAGLEPAVSMAHMNHGERKVQTTTTERCGFCVPIERPDGSPA